MEQRARDVVMKSNTEQGCHHHEDTRVRAVIMNVNTECGMMSWMGAQSSGVGCHEWERRMRAVVMKGIQSQGCRQE
jgi:hypothetical protein